MSRENEKVLTELRKFLELHDEELNDEKDFDRLTAQFLSQHNGSPDGGSMEEIETANDYLELAEQAASKKKRLTYLKKALELEPDHVDAQLQLILTEAEDHLKQLASVNKDTKKFLRIMINGEPDALIDHLDPYGYRPFTIEELVEDLVGNAFLFSSVPHFFAWASNCLIKCAGGKAKR